MKLSLHNLARSLALVVMAALVLRPVVVSTQNASTPQIYSFSAQSLLSSGIGHAAQDRAFAKAPAHNPLRSLQKEKQDPTVWGPCVSKAVAPQVASTGLLPHSLSPSSSSLRTFQVLRI